PAPPPAVAAVDPSGNTRESVVVPAPAPTPEIAAADFVTDTAVPVVSASEPAVPARDDSTPQAVVQPLAFAPSPAPDVAQSALPASAPVLPAPSIEEPPAEAP